MRATLLLSAAAFMLTACPVIPGVEAQAQWQTTRTCSGDGHTRTCSFLTYRIAPRAPIVQHVTAPLMESDADRAERADRVAKWEGWCNPQAVTDALGVSRYTYAHAGCDVGRSE